MTGVKNISIESQLKELYSDRDFDRVPTISGKELERAAISCIYERCGGRTNRGSLFFTSTIKSRSAKFTMNTIDNPNLNEEYIAAAEDVLSTTKNMVAAVGSMGDSTRFRFNLRLIVPRGYEHLLYVFQRIFSPDVYEDAEWLTVVARPDLHNDSFDDRRVIAMSDLTLIKGTPYCGEVCKKSFHRMGMYQAKIKCGGIGLHSASKGGIFKSKLTGKTREVYSMFFGLSMTGKSSLSLHPFTPLLREGERVFYIQDDINILFPDGFVAGTEPVGMYTNIWKLSPKNQPDVYKAVMSQNTILENTLVENGEIILNRGIPDPQNNWKPCKNPRATILRKDLPNVSMCINAPIINHFYIITRSKLMPPIGKLTGIEQFLAYFAEGKSVMTAAGDPSRAGESVRVFGTNPFTMGSRGKELKILESILYSIKSKYESDNIGPEFFILNTLYFEWASNKNNSLGKWSRLAGLWYDISIDDTIKLLVANSRGDIEWQKDPDGDFGFILPKKVYGVGFGKSKILDPHNLILNKREFSNEIEKEREETKNYLRSIEDFDLKLLKYINTYNGECYG